MRPRVIVHNLMSLDGRLDVPAPDVALYYELAAGLGADAMLCGSETMLVAFGDEAPQDAIADVLPPHAKRPLLVVVDSRGRVRCWDRIVKAPHWRAVLSLCSGATPRSHLEYLQASRIPTLLTAGQRVDLASSLEKLANEYEIGVIRVDSGGILNGALLGAGLVDEVALLVAPVAVGSHSPASLFVVPEDSKPVANIQLSGVEVKRGGHVWMRYEVK